MNSFRYLLHEVIRIDKVRVKGSVRPVEVSRHPLHSKLMISVDCSGSIGVIFFREGHLYFGELLSKQLSQLGKIYILGSVTSAFSLINSFEHRFETLPDFGNLASGHTNPVIAMVLADYNPQLRRLDLHKRCVLVAPFVWYKPPIKIIEKKPQICSYLFPKFSL